MKKKLGLLASSMMIFAAQSSSAVAQGFSLDGMGLGGNLCPYIGADVAWRHMGFQGNNGGKLVKKDYPQGNIYLGLKFNDCIGFEVGYEATTTRRRTATIASNEPSNFGAITDPESGLGSTFRTSSKIQGWHFDLVGFYPLSCWDDCLSVVGSVGVANLRLKISETPQRLVGGTEPVFTSDTNTFKSRKWLARLGLGLQYMLTECAGVRGMVNWENTHRFKNIPARQDNVFRATARNSTALSLGVFYNF